MTTLLNELTPLRRRDDGERIRRGPQGAYREASDGLVIRLTAAEAPSDAEAAQRALLALACREALECGGGK
jgi:hypothetical protein